MMEIHLQNIIPQRIRVSLKKKEGGWGEELAHKLFFGIK